MGTQHCPGKVQPFVQGEGGGNGLQDAAGGVLSQNAETDGEEQQEERY